MPKKILIFGTFDLLHPGHRYVIEEAMKRGDTHIVVARDHHVEQIKHRAPQQTEKERLQAIRNTYPSATVMLGDSEDFLQPVRNVQPDLILLGYDQQFPPGITEEDLPCPIERLEAYEPEKWKTSLQRK